MGGVALFLAVASLGLPGLANFVGEFLVLTGTFAVNPPLAAVAAVGFVLSSIYSLWLIYRVFQGPQRQTRPTADLGRRELAIFACLIAVIVWLGIYPQPVLNAARPTVDSLTSSVTYVMRGEGVRLPGTANLGPQTRKIAFGSPIPIGSFFHATQDSGGPGGPGSPNAIRSRLGTHDAFATENKTWEREHDGR
jgi:NADH:ubiquinone oxidoreductase subunit 5 (subunit L)/multisubunit Na+/H+ antiporter MnhA subunit